LAGGEGDDLSGELEKTAGEEALILVTIDQRALPAH